MKRVIQLGMIWLILIALGGCSMMNKQEESNIALSAEHEALCNSKNTLNKKLCRQTMGQLPKFESDINTYFKEKFNIDGFKLTGINFPYDGFNHGGFHATFQQKEGVKFSFFGTFDYKNNQYVFRPFTNSSEENTVQSILASSFLLHLYAEKLKLKDLRTELQFLDYSGQREDFVFGNGIAPYYNEEKFFMLRSFLSTYTLSIDSADEVAIIENLKKHNVENKIEQYMNKYSEQLEKTTISVITKGESKEDILEKYKQYTVYLAEHKNEKLDKTLYYFNNSKELHYITEDSEGMIVDGEKR